MLAEEADAFRDWRMFMGHLTPEMAQAMNKAGRSIDDLGGRVVESWWNPDYATPDDATYGFERGAVMGRAIPYPAVKALLEADPKALAVSINAWPKGATPGTDAKGQRGMVIEGFRRQPQGSVDWVISAGAGGGVVSEERAVSLLEGIYDPAHGPGGSMNEKTFSELTEEEFRAKVKAEAPHLLDALAEEDDGGHSGDITGIDEATVRGLLAEQAQQFEEKLSEAVEGRATEIVNAREKHRTFSERARAKIERAEGLTDGHKTDLIARYSLGDNGTAAAGLLVESAEDLDKAVDDDVKHALDLIRESRPGARVSGLGDGGGDDGKPPRERAERKGGWSGVLQEMGAMPLTDEGQPDKDTLLDGMVN